MAIDHLARAALCFAFTAALGVSVASLTGRHGFAQLIPLALYVETAIGFVAGMIYSRQRDRVALHGAS